MRYYSNGKTLLGNVIDTKPNEEEIRRSNMVSNDIYALANPSLISSNASSLYSILIDAPKDIGLLVNGDEATRYKACSILEHAKIVSNTSTNPGLFYGYIEPSVSKGLNDANMLISYPECIISESSTFLAGEIISIIVRNNCNPMYSNYETYILPLLSELIISTYKNTRPSINIIRLIQQKMFNIVTNLNHVKSQIKNSILKDTRLKLYAEYNNLVGYLNCFYIVLCLYSRFLQHPDDMRKKIVAVLNNELSIYQLIDEDHIGDNSYSHGLDSYSKYLKKV